MKKLNIFNIFFLLLLPLLAGCSQEKIVFDIEKSQFPTRPDYQLLEVIVPQGTAATDKLYIVGEFNGGMDAVGNPMWELEKAAESNDKWGIYLNPADFVAGKTLADGYTFYSEQQGVERSLENTAVIHTESPKVGDWTNVIVYRWAEYFNEPEGPAEIVHDGYVIYVVDNTGYDELAMYTYVGKEPVIYGPWPGTKPTGEVEIDGVNYKYFDTGAENEGMDITVIFNNNNNGKQLPDYNITLNQDFYFELTPTDVIDLNANDIEHDGYSIFIKNNTDWEDVYVYMWGTVNNLNGGFPGMKPTGTQFVKGVKYLYYDLGAANCDGSLEEHVIINNGTAGDQPGGIQFDNVVIFNLDHNVYIDLTNEGATEIFPVEDETPAKPKEYKIYVQDELGWEDLYLYAYIGSKPFGEEWPGITTTETKVVGANTYKVFTLSGNGETVNLIFNDNDKAQSKELKITLDQDYFIVLSSAIIAETTEPEYSLYIEDKTGWDNFSVYGWAENLPELFGGWPGKVPEQTETIDGVTYKVLTFKGNGATYNLIFNNKAANDADNLQYDAAKITLDKDYFITALPEEATVKE